MNRFFDDRLFLSTPEAEALYAEVKELPILDYHCHLNEIQIKEDYSFSNIGELWLGGDHYKWRAMRLCGVDEHYITGDASWREKFDKYAEIFPSLCGNALYYWTQLELKLIFGIETPLSSATADEIWKCANEQLATVKVSDLLSRFKVEYVATTDDPVSSLSAHGTYGGTVVAPTFRPDRFLNVDPTALSELETVIGYKLDTLAAWKRAMLSRLDYFCTKGCRIADCGMDFLPGKDPSEEEAAALYATREALTAEEKHTLFSHLFYFLAAAFHDRDITLQLHFATYRNVNSAAFPTVGRDAGYDIMRGHVDPDRMVTLLDTLNTRGKLPRTLLYTLNPTAVPALAALSGAFPNVRIGAAWWFNDTLLGIRRQLENIAEYAALGTHLGMLTDSRSFASYVRFDFFRRILADFVGGYVARGEYDMDAAKVLMEKLCYSNTRDFLGL